MTRPHPSREPERTAGAHRSVAPKEGEIKSRRWAKSGSWSVLVGHTGAVDYNLRGLGAAEFEALCKAIVGNVFGPNVRNFEPSRPRRWEAEFEGSFSFHGSSQTGWDGFGVLIVKYSSRQLSPTQAATWLRQALRPGLDALSGGGGYKREQEDYRQPEYILFATNVYLGIGEIDSTNNFIEEYASTLNLQAWQLWAGDDISRYLDSSADVRYGFVLGHDYVSHASVGSQSANFARYELTDLESRPPDIPEVVGAWWRLMATHQTVTGLFRTLYMVRQRTLSGQVQAQEPLSDGVQDLLRAAIVFTSAGIDACLESLLTHALPVLAANNENARRKFEIYIENQVNAPKTASAFVEALKSPDPRSRLVELYILGLTGSSFQGSGSIKDRALAALGVTNSQLSNGRVKSLDPFFIARNDVVHKLDLIQPSAPYARPSSKPRGQDDVGYMCDEALLLMRDIVVATAFNLAECHNGGL
jgi:hypothetical protein